MLNGLLRTAAAALACWVVAPGAVAQSTAAGDSYPTRPIRLIVPFPPGGFSDLLGRLVGQGLSEGTGQPVIIDNRPGASGNIGADAVAKAQPDGYTLLVNSLNYVIGPNVMAMPFDTLADFAPVSMVAGGPPQVLVVNPASGHRTVADLVGYARSNPGKLNIATAGAGTGTHLVGEMFRNYAKIEAVLVPYKGGPAEFGAVVSGEANVNFPLLAAALPLIQSGKLKPLAVTSAKRVPLLSDVPTMAEAGLQGFEADNFIGLVAPAKTPRTVIARLQREVAALAKKQDFVDRIERLGMRPVGSSPEEFDTFIREQIRKWAEVAKASGTGKAQ